MTAVTSPARATGPPSAAVTPGAFGAEATADARRRARGAARRVVRARLKPPPRLTVSQWADRYRMLSPEASSRRGRFSTDAAPYQREPMDVCGDRRHPRVILMWASQLGKTELLNNVIGYRIDQDPGPMLMVQPTLEMAETWSKDRLAPMLRDTPRLKGKVADARSRDSGNTLLHKQFEGGHVTAAGANSPAGLASRPIRDLYLDEWDRFPKGGAGSEGDSSAIAESRMATFPDGTLRGISSPTTEDESAIAAEYEKSDQREYFVPCPHCRHEQTLEFGGRDVASGLKWDGPADDPHAYYVCKACGAVCEEYDKPWMLAHGRWIPQNPDSSVPGFRLSALYSPFYSWKRLVRRWLRDKHDPLKLQAFVNTILCELWRPLAGEKLDPTALAARLEAFQPRLVIDGRETDDADRSFVPDGAGVLVRVTDTQGDRLETAVWAFGGLEENWLIDFDLIPGDPSIPFRNPASPWNELDAIIKRRVYRHASGADLRPQVTFIDSGGHAAGEVYAFTKERNHLGVYAIKGLAEQEGAPLLGKPTRNNRAKAILYPVGSFTGKETVAKRMGKITEPGPGYTHLPDWLSGEQISQFTHEKLVTKIVGGRAKRVWVQTGRTEMFHLHVYALAALEKLGPAVKRSLGALAARITAEGRAKTAQASAEAPASAPPPPRAAPPRRGASWATGWKR